MTIIVLGEVLLSTTGAIGVILDGGTLSGQLIMTVIGGLLIVFCLWWFYFKHSHAQQLEEDGTRPAFVWGYGHYVLYAAIAAVGAGLGVCIDVLEHVAHVSSRAANLTLGVPVAVALVLMGFLHARDVVSWEWAVRAGGTAGAVLVVAVAGWETGLTVLLIAAVLVASLVLYLVQSDPAPAEQLHGTTDRLTASEAQNE
jgi:low temperature requirement protein LtrA